MGKKDMYIYLNSEWFKKNDIVTTSDNKQWIIIKMYKYTKFKMFLQYITKGLYKCPQRMPVKYKVKRKHE